MRILWIGKQPTDGQAGDEVFDRKTIAACRQRGATIDLVHPARVGRAAELINLAVGQPHYRARYASYTNRAAVIAASRGCDVAVCSWEPFDTLGFGLPCPTLLILHNVTSRSLPQMFPSNPLATLGAARARAWEWRRYSPNNISAIGALSRPDLAYLATLPNPPELLWLPPGMPPTTPLSPDAPLVPELVIAGTYEWRPKRRDALLFAQEYAAVTSRLLVRAPKLPGAAAELLQVAPPPSTAETSAALRFGLITDRFEAGHKLKTLAYIADNQIVLSFTDVTADFAHLADHALFICTLSNAIDIARHVAKLVQMHPSELRSRFTAFKEACARQFTWDAVARTLLHAASIAAARGTVGSAKRS